MAFKVPSAAPTQAAPRSGGFRVPGQAAPREQSVLDKTQNYAESIGKGLLRSVGYVREYDPEESQALGGAAEIVGNAAQFIPILRGAGLAARGVGLAARAAPLAARALTPRALSLASLAASSGVAAGVQEAIKETVGAVTQGREFRPRSIATQALYGAAIPVAFTVPGAAVRGVLGAIPALERTTMSSLARRVPTGTAGKIVAAHGQTLERRAALSGQAGKFHVENLINAAERGGGFTSGLGARFGGNVMYGVTQNIAAAAGHPTPVSKALANAARWLRTQPAVTTNAAGQKVVRFGPRTKDMTSGEISRAVDAISGVLSDPYFKRNIAEKEILSLYKDSLRMEIMTPTRKLEGVVKNAMTHAYLGLLNVGSAVVNMSSLYTNVVTKYGADNTAWAIQQYFRGGPEVQAITRRVIGKGFGQMAGQGGTLGVSKLARASTSMIAMGENFMRPVAALANYRAMIQAGKTPVQALRAAQKAARSTLHDYQYNAPRLMKQPGLVGSAMRVGLQFYNYPLHQVNFGAGLNIPQFAQYVTNLFMGGGAVAASGAVPGLREAVTMRLPFGAKPEEIQARATERLPYVMAGVSLLDRLLADPETRDLVEGPAAKLTGVSLGRRIDPHQGLITRVMGMEDGPYKSWAKNFGEAWEKFQADPGPETLRGLAATLTLAGQRVTQAVTAEKAGKFTTKTGQQVAEATPAETARMALGFVPTNLSSARAFGGIQQSLDERRDAQTAEVRRQLRLAIHANDRPRMDALIGRMVELGYDSKAIRRIFREAALPPDDLEVRQTPETMRGPMRALQEKREERTQRKPGFKVPKQ